MTGLKGERSPPVRGRVRWAAVRRWWGRVVPISSMNPPPQSGQRIESWMGSRMDRLHL